MDLLLQPHADWLRLTLALACVIIFAYVIAQLAGAIARAALMAVVRHDGAKTLVTSIVHRPIRIIRAAVFLSALLVLSLPALEFAGLQPSVGLTSRALSVWLFGSGLRIAVIAILSYILLRIIAATSRRLEDEMSQVTAADQVERLKRARTVSRLAHNAMTALVMGMATLMVLRELDVDIMPILTGAGIVGLAVGFGAQTLVKDLIAGFFLTLENQVRVGDVAVINGTGGLVEEINLRTIVLRDGDGAVHIFPNGSIERLSNQTREFAYAVVDVGAAYSEDPDAIMESLREIGARLAADPQFGPSILKQPEVLGPEALEDAKVVFKLRIKTLPLKQWEIERELRRRILQAMGSRELLVPIRKVTLRVSSDAAAVPVATADQRTGGTPGKTGP
jgi:small-conductance mechanosensitive channel